MTEEQLSGDEIGEMGAYVDIDAPPPQGLPVAVFVFGTNKLAAVETTAALHRQGRVGLIITTGGVNRHDGRIEGPWLRDELVERGVPASAIRVEDASNTTEENVINALGLIQEMRGEGLSLVAVSKWWHRRTMHALATHVPGLDSWYAIGYDPVYTGQVVTRANWPGHPEAARRVVREAREIPHRVSEGSLVDVELVDGAWRPVQ
ncbi:YdcF family protein [Phytomonospora sp. NPDC050363]|uniref:YdcF family protein n=1 Tax=Phytomonospora sp. NPDC050363 TaxID=3155642 RepID=UPI0033EC270D